MKPLLFLLAGALLASAQVRAASNEEVDARKIAYELAGAFSNDGFKLRDGCFTGRFDGKKSHLLQVNLFAGNQYWFSVGTTEGAKKVAVSVYDETGKPVAFDPFNEDGKAAAGFAPTASGAYFVKVEELEGSAATFCLLYSYK